MVYPFTGDHKQKFYWGHKEILVPVYKSMEDAFKVSIIFAEKSHQERLT